MKQFSEETRRKMSESAKRRCSDPKWLEHQHNRATKLPLETVKAMYEGGSTQAEIAEALGVSQKVVWRFMKNHGIKARVPAKRDQHSEKNSYWRGGIVKDDAGYSHYDTILKWYEEDSKVSKKSHSTGVKYSNFDAEEAMEKAIKRSCGTIENI